MEPKQAQFIELRAAGKSYNNIADQLKVSKSTLIKWSREFTNEINNAKALQIESIREEFMLTRQHRIQFLGSELNNIVNEILNRDMTEVPTWRLFDMQRKVIAHISKDDEPIEFAQEIRKDTPESLDNLFKKTVKWTG